MDRTEGRSPRSLVTLQQLVGAAERLARKVPKVPREEWLGLVDQVRDRLSAPVFEALPLDGFSLKDNGKERLIAAPRPLERLLEEALLPKITRRLEGLLAAGAHGYRPGKSTLTAAAAASRALAGGHHFLLFLDIADFYPSLDRSRLEVKLKEAFDAPLAALLIALVSAPTLFNGELLRSSRGIPLGRAVSPPLSNIYLRDLDAALCTAERASEWTYLRYADDVLVLAKTEAARDEAERRVEAELSRVGLALKPEKKQLHHFDGNPVLYLGHTVDDRGVYQRVAEQRLERILGAARGRAKEALDADESPEPAEQPSLRAHTLYITEPGAFVRTAQGRIVVQQGKEITGEVPLHRIDRVLVLAGVGMSSGFLSACIAQNVPVLFFIGKGKAYGSLVAEGMPNPLRLRAQYDLTGDPRRRLDLARSLIGAKIVAMIKRLANAKQAAAARERLREMLSAALAAQDVQALRGFEGNATKTYYEGYATRFRRPGFELVKRTKRPPRDALNSLLSFAYSLIFSEMQTALLAHGLDPYPGLLHDLRRGHPALASDLSEPYRVLVADSFVLMMVNEGRVGLDGFEKRSNGGVYMAGDTRRAVIEAYEGFMSRRGGGGRGTPPRVLIDAGARAMLRVVLGEAETLDLPPALSILENKAPEAPAAPSGSEGAPP